jgi:hypothetical protein
MVRARVIAGFLLSHEPPRAGTSACDWQKLGVVHFGTSCNARAQNEFDRAAALLHSFQFRRAIEGFNAALAQDATCGIAYWGIALSDWSNPFAAGMKVKGQLQAGRESVERGKTTGAKTERERAYLAAVGKLYGDFENTPGRTRLIAYHDAMQEVAEKYPDDHEAQIFEPAASAVTVQRPEVTGCNSMAPIATLGAPRNPREVLLHPNCTQIRRCSVLVEFLY